MLSLKLRQEFLGRVLGGTVIEIGSRGGGKHLRQSAQDFLNITYPSHDVIKTLECVAPGRGKAVVIMGDRGQGKSHVLATLYHAVSKPDSGHAWLQHWADRLHRPEFKNIQIREDMHVIVESLHEGSYKTLWELLFDRHPEGKRFLGQWETKRTPWPEKEILVAMFRSKPTMLILDELSTWYGSLINQPSAPLKEWAFLYCQILAEIAATHPDILVLVATVLHGNNEAYQQIHRVGEQLIDFKGTEAVVDRRRLLLHRLFENRGNIPSSEIDDCLKVHVGEYIRLNNIDPKEHERLQSDFRECWPFSPRLLTLLEKQLVLAVKLQETRDLIKLLASIFKSASEHSLVITPADVDVESSTSEFVKLLSGAAETTLRDLRDKALVNLQAVRESEPNYAQVLPDLKEIMGSLWLRSITVGNTAGATIEDLQSDVTKAEPKNDNLFLGQVLKVVESSFNIHKIADLFVFRSEENPETRLLASARNDRLFSDGSDELQLQKEIEYIFSDRVSTTHEVIVLPRDWQYNVWAKIDPKKHPANWAPDKLPIVIIPVGLENKNRELGNWLKGSATHRNTYRFVFPKRGEKNVYSDREILVSVRAALKAGEWKKAHPEYVELEKTYRVRAHEALKKRFSRFAVLQKFSHNSPDQCEFEEADFEGLEDKKINVAETLESTISTNHWEAELFEELVAQLSQTNSSVAKLLEEIREPAPNGAICIPWLGEVELKERLLKLCAAGKISILIRGTELLQNQPGEGKDDTFRRIKGKLGSGKVLSETQIQPPVIQTGGGTISRNNDSESLSVPDSISQTPADIGYSASPDLSPQPESTTQFGNSVGNIFAQKSRRPVSCTNETNSVLNHLGAIERWGIGPATEVKNISIRLDQLTGSQLTKIVRSLPPEIRFALELVKEEEE